MSVDSETLSCQEAAEILRKKNRYRELILSGKLILPFDKVAKLLGPDCMYHLYSFHRIESRRRERKADK